MNKLYISHPMNGLDEEVILRTREHMHKIAEIIFGEELEVIDSYDPEFKNKMFPEGVDRRIVALGESIKKMAYADYFIGVEEDWMFPGTSIEKSVAYQYNIPVFTIKCDYICPEASQKYNDEHCVVRCDCNEKSADA